MPRSSDRCRPAPIRSRWNVRLSGRGRKGSEIARTSARVVPAGSADSLVLAHTPTLGIRADTIGTASDIPLMLYVEDDRRAGRGWVRYSVIISHEDGGTPAPALMARWGRTTDIELIYEVELDGARLVQDRFQGPDHEVRAVRRPARRTAPACCWSPPSTTCSSIAAGAWRACAWCRARSTSSAGRANR